MKKSEQINELAKALSMFQGEYNQIKFDGKVKVQTKSGSSYTFEYATLSNVVENTRKILSKNGLSFTQIIDGENLLGVLMHHSGQWIESEMKMNLQGKTNQEQGAEISYKRRYQQSCILNITSDEDEDSNSIDSKGFQKENTKKIEPKQSIFESKKKKPELTETQYRAMLSTIIDKRDWKTVSDALPKYEIKSEWKEELLSSIDMEKKLTK